MVRDGAFLATDPKALWWRWVRATALGWLLGLALVIALAALWSLFFPEAQFMVGVGLGAGVGFAQARVLSAWLDRRREWMLASTVGMGALFVLGDVVAATGTPLPFYQPVHALLGALVVGLWQRSLLRRVSGRASWWIVASVLGWALPAMGVELAGFEGTGFFGDLIGLGTIFFGGVPLGAVSGGVLVWIVREPLRRT